MPSVVLITGVSRDLGAALAARLSADPDCGQLASVHHAVHGHLRDPHHARHLGDGQETDLVQSFSGLIHLSHTFGT